MRTAYRSLLYLFYVINKSRERAGAKQQPRCTRVSSTIRYPPPNERTNIIPECTLVDRAINGRKRIINSVAGDWELDTRKYSSILLSHRYTLYDSTGIYSGYCACIVPATTAPSQYFLYSLIYLHYAGFTSHLLNSL